jgi:hypothetical protein
MRCRPSTSWRCAATDGRSRQSDDGHRPCRGECPTHAGCRTRGGTESGEAAAPNISGAKIVELVRLACPSVRPIAGEVLHFSEDPGITEFVPHVAPTARVSPAYVWAVDAARAPDYWFPRNCPRMLAWTTPHARASRYPTTGTARAVRFLGGGDRELARLERNLAAQCGDLGPTIPR